MGGKEKLNLKDKLELVHIRDKNRKIVRNKEDLIVNIGKITVVKLLYDNTEPEFGWIAIGTETTEAGASNTTLESEITTGGGARGAASVSIVDTNIAQFEKSFTFTSSFAITESGLFNASGANSGDMLCRQVFPAINVVSDDVLVARWKIGW